jgi:hypothetical protein
MRVMTTTLERHPRSEGAEDMIKKLEYLIEACRSGKLHQIVLLSHVDGDGHRMSTLLCVDDAHACAFIDRSASALLDLLEREFVQAVDKNLN